MKLYDERGHLTDGAVAAPPEELTADQLLDRAEHLANCGECALRFALRAAECPAPEPVGLAARTAVAIRADRQKERNGRFASFFKVAVAAVFAVTLFGTGVFGKLAGPGVPLFAEQGQTDGQASANGQVHEKEQEKRQTLFDGFMESFDKFAGAVNRIDLGVNDNGEKK